MALNIKSKKEQKGSALYFSLVIMVVMLSIVVGLSIVLITQIRIMKGIEFSVAAFYAADAGTEQALYNVRQINALEDFSGIIDSTTNYEVKILLRNIGVDPSHSDYCEAESYCIKAVGFFGGTQRAIETTF